MKSFIKKLTLNVRLNGKDHKFIFRVEKGVKSDFIRLVFPKSLEVFEVHEDTVAIREKQKEG